ncbi:MAG: B12-binding domain-containing radical SAM protein [Geminicoccaceae bacterium]
MPVAIRGQAVEGSETFLLFLIKPSHYDDAGFVIQWARNDMPSNTLATLYGIALDCEARGVLGDGVDLRISALDETNRRIRTGRIIRAFRRAGGKGLVALVGVQSNQYPRALDLARPLRAAGIPVCIGGFHTAGSLAMLPKAPPEIQDAWDLGISIFAGEAEGRLDEVLRDAKRGALRPLYRYTSDLPDLQGAPPPFLPQSTIRRNLSARTTFDAGRGCPFQCSFCTIINVQGRKSRYRSADDVERIVRNNAAQGIRHFFITDDNFARNRNWEAIFDRLIQLREDESVGINLIIQVDTLCHLIPNFIRKAGRAGVTRAFIGLENINPDNLIGAKKKQNRITEYRTMLQAWKAIGVITCCGYIIGFPNDTRERVLRDVEIIKRELPTDLLEFFYLTPLPGSEDHQILHQNGVWMDPDLNIYDAEHVTTGHPLMSADEWRRTYREAWAAFYTPEHVETLMRRAVACGIRARKIMMLCLWFYGSIAIESVHPLQGGLFRRKYRRDRRPGLPAASLLTFYPRYAFEILSKTTGLLALAWRYDRIRRRVEADPAAAEYRDLALTPVTEAEIDDLEIFRATESARQAVAKARRQRAQQRPLHPVQAA